MQPDKKAKVFAMKSIMNNPKLSKVLSDGYNSPIGSTKRDQAKSVVSILKRLGSSGNPGINVSFTPPVKQNPRKQAYNDIYQRVYGNQGGSPDGQGGPTDNANPFLSTANNPLVPSFIKRAPEPANNFSSKISTTTSASTAPMISGTAAPAAPTAWTGTSYKPGEGIIPFLGKNVIPLTEYVTGKTLEQAKKNKDATLQAVAGAILGTSAIGEMGLGTLMGTSTGKPVPFGETSSMQIYNQLFPAKVPTALAPSPTLPKAPGTSIAATTGATGPAVTGTPGTIVQTSGNSYTYINRDGTIHKGTLGDNYVDNTTAITAGTTGPAPTDVNLLAGTQYESTWATLTPEQKKQIADSLGAAPSDTTVTSTATTPVDTGTVSGTNPFAGTSYESAWNSLPDNVKQAALTAPTPGAFADAIMSSPSALATLAPQYLEELRAMHPRVPDAQLPLASGLNGQIDDLKNRLAEENQLTTLGNEYQKMITSGNTLQPDLTSYIKGRDTYIKDVDNMINQVKTNMATGMHDPATMAANNGYIDYLSVLKGRQNNRYIDLLQMSVTSHDNQMKTITNAYNNAKKNYDDELASGQKMTTDRYNQVYGDLTNLYNLVQGAPAAAQDAELKKQQVLNAQYDNAKLKLDLGTTTTNDFMKEAMVYDSQLLDKTTDTTTGKSYNTFMPEVNLYNEAAAALGSGKSVNSLLYIISEGIAAAKTTSEVESVKAKINSFLASGGEALLAQYGYTPTDSSGNSVPLSTVFDTAMQGPKITAYESDLKIATVPALQKLLNYLVKIDPKKIASKKAEYDKNAAQYGITDTSLSDAIWNYYTGTALKQFGPSAATVAGRKSMFSLLDPNSTTGFSDLAKSLAASN